MFPKAVSARRLTTPFGCATKTRSRRGAVLQTPVEQVRRHGADPLACFEWVFEKLMLNPPSGQLDELLPAHWIKTRLVASQAIESSVA